MYTPDDEAIKCWAGNLGLSATHAIIFAQLYINRRCYGLHAFCMQIRETKKLTPLKGIEIGDMKEKNIKEQQLASLAILSVGRAAVVGKGTVAVRLAAVIATRYCAVRKQFHVGNHAEERSVIEYPLQQQRLFPHIASSVALTIFYRKFISICYKHFVRCIEDERFPYELMLSRELEILSCAAKVLSTETGVNALDDARLACGAHGFLKCSRLNDLRDAFDPSRTFEGDNNILVQKVTHVLLALSDESVHDWKDSPLGSLAFLDFKPEKFSAWKDDQLEDITNAYIWLLHSLVSTIKDDIENKLHEGFDLQQARILAQSEQYRMITYAYCELAILNCVRESLQTAPEVIREVFHRVAVVYGYSSIKKYMTTFYIGGYCSCKQWGNTVKRRLREAEASMLPDAISICDALAPPDFILHSILGSSDGQLYQRLIHYLT
uniref:Acyl-CoA oxidase C-terminal domain-containing protein n=1 Tax=Setaria digitata TaxID=48799 RepID=A0A915Q318_9BILA